MPLATSPPPEPRLLDDEPRGRSHPGADDGPDDPARRMRSLAQIIQTGSNGETSGSV